MPSAPIVVKTPAEGRGSGNKERKLAGERDNERLNTHMGSSFLWEPETVIVRGWKPTCDHGVELVPATVLDPFSGSGPTLATAKRYLRKGIGIDLSAAYLDLAIQRLRDVTPGYQSPLELGEEQT